VTNHDGSIERVITLRSGTWIETPARRKISPADGLRIDPLRTAEMRFMDTDRRNAALLRRSHHFYSRFGCAEIRPEGQTFRIPFYCTHHSP
jgi:hypothetical protein